MQLAQPYCSRFVVWGLKVFYDMVYTNRSSLKQITEGLVSNGGFLISFLLVSSARQEHYSLYPVACSQLGTNHCSLNFFCLFGKTYLIFEMTVIRIRICRQTGPCGRVPQNRFWFVPNCEQGILCMYCVCLLSMSRDRHRGSKVGGVDIRFTGTKNPRGQFFCSPNT